MSFSTIFSRSLLVAALGLGASLAACGGDLAPGGGSTVASSSGGSTGSAVSSSASGGGGGETPELAYLAKFDAAKYQLPEGLWVTPDSKTAYVGFAATGQIMSVALADDTVSEFATVPAPPANKGFVTGITQSAAGDLYVAAASLDSTAYQGAIYKVPPKGGAVTTPFAADPAMTLPNGLVLDSDGSLFVTDSGLGAIFKVSPDGKTVSNWLTDPLLKGDSAASNPCKSVLGIPFGANGLALSNHAFYVANTDKASLIKIPIKADGTPGVALAFFTSDPVTCLPLQGADGITADVDGSIYVAGNGGNSLVHVGVDGKAKVLSQGGLFDGPASVSLATLNSKKYALMTNFGFISLVQKKTPHVGLLSFGPLQ
jgi:sugar lactone lactonase YvrE